MQVALKIAIHAWGALCALPGGRFVLLDPTDRHSTYIRLDALESLTCY